MRILLVDDHPLFREGLASLLASQSDLSVVGQASSVSEAVAAVQALQPDLVLMDFTLQDGNGLEATNAILALRPGTKVVFLTVHGDDDQLFAALRSGAKGFLLKNTSVQSLLSFLRGVERGEPAISPSMTSRVLEEFARLRPGASGTSALPAELTRRERDVLQELANGSTNREIAESLVVAESTVKNHVRSILSKLGLQNRRQAANFVHQQRFRH